MAKIDKDLDFLIIGVGKSGTTSLASYISQHPDIIITDPKEPWFFDTNDYQNGMAWYWKKYLSHFAGEKCVGEASSHTLFVPFTAERLHKTVPNAKLIVILRNPIKRAYSDWWMKYCANVETDDFETAIEKNLKQIEDDVDFSNPSIWQDHIDSHKHSLIYKTYIDFGYYATQLERYFTYFPKKQILILLSDDLVINPVHTIHKTWEFLGVNMDIDEIHLSLKQENVAKSPLEDTVRKSIVSLPVVGNITKSLPRCVKNMLLAPFKTVYAGKKPMIPENIENKLENHYNSEIKHLEHILKRDLSMWAKTRRNNGFF